MESCTWRRNGQCVDNKVNNLKMKETTCPKRDLDKDWVEDWLTDAIQQNEPNLDESEYERTFVSARTD